MEWDAGSQAYTLLEKPRKGEVLVYPTKMENGVLTEKNWQRGHNRVIAENAEGEYRVRRANGEICIDFKTRMDEAALPTSWWDNNEYASANYAATQLKDLFGENPFDYGKAIKIVEDAIQVCGAVNNETVLDYFAGSGTTAHAVINLNRADGGGKRRYILVEMGEYFDTVTKPRVIKVIYSDKWKAGKPADGGKGSSHAFKYLRLESYEDALGNITLPETAASPQFFGEDYRLRYMLQAEAEGQSLLPPDHLANPFEYQLLVTRKNESKATAVDLPETFNYLIGLTVIKSHARVSFDAAFDRGEYGALSARLTAGGAHTFKAVEGRLPNGETALVLWRSRTDDAAKDDAVLAAYRSMFGAYKNVFVNGDCTLEDALLTEEWMRRKMFGEA